MNIHLDAIVSYIDPEDIVADIGSDHGYIPLCLAKMGHPYVYASENKKGPFNRLVKEITPYRNIINPDLSDGLDKLPLKVNTIIMAGMGGTLINSILLREPHKLQNIDKLVLAPQGGEPQVRLTLKDLGYQIVMETVVEDEGHFYEIIVANKAKSPVKLIDPEFGDLNIANPQLGFIAKWDQIYAINTKLLANSLLTDVRRKQISIQQQAIKQALGKE